MKKNTVFICCIVAIIFAAGGVFGGMKYQQSKTPQFNRGQFANGAQNGQTRNRAGGGMVNGTILSVDTTSMTVKLPDNSSKIVILSSTTTYAKSTDGAQTDLKLGDRVNAFGATNTDGSVTAQSIQINPPAGGRMERISPTP